MRPNSKKTNTSGSDSKSSGPEKSRIPRSSRSIVKKLGLRKVWVSPRLVQSKIRGRFGGLLTEKETQRVLEMSKIAESYMTKKDWRAAEKHWRDIVLKFKKRTPSGTYVRLSICFRMQQNFGAAKEIINKGIGLHPKYAPLYIEQAEIEMDKGNYRRASQMWKKITKDFGEITPEDVWLKLTRSYRLDKNFNLALETAKKALAKVSDKKSIQIEIAQAHVDMGKYDKAVAEWQPILSSLDKTTSIDEWKRLREARVFVSASKRVDDLNEYKRVIEDYVDGKSRKKPRIAVYTAIVGGYEKIKLPEKLNKNIDYIVFSDEPIENTGVFEVRPITYFGRDATTSARYVKTHPHMLLGDYDLAIWVDASIMMLSDLNNVLDEFISSKKPIAAIPHPERQSVYEEGEACLAWGKGDGEIIKEQMDFYRQEKFDCDDLIESGLMIFDLKNSKSVDFLNEWWAQMDRFSMRDQLSANYAMQKTNVNWHRLMKKPRCIRNHPDFVLTLHGDKNPRYEKLLDVLSDGNIDPLKVESFAKDSNKKLSKYKDVDIEIIVCVHNAPKETLNCLNSISKNRTKKTKLIVVDDGSGEETKKILQEFVHGKDWVKLLRNETANGYTKAANKGLRASTAPLVILQNSDTVATKDWAAKMAYVLDVSPGAGIVGTLSSAAGHQSIPRHKSGKTQTAINRLPKNITPENINSLCEKWAPDVYPRVPLVHGFCFGIKREVIEKIGYFDEQKFPRGYGEENDYCFRATNAGISSVIATNTYVYHEKSKSYVDEVRIGLMKSGSEQLTKAHGANRIKNSVLAVDFNPLIENVRQKYINHFKV